MHARTHAADQKFGYTIEKRDIIETITFINKNFY